MQRPPRQMHYYFPEPFWLPIGLFNSIISYQHCANPDFIYKMQIVYVFRHILLDIQHLIKTVACKFYNSNQMLKIVLS